LREATEKQLAGLNREYAEARFFNHDGDHIQSIQYQLMLVRGRVKKLNIHVDSALKTGHCLPIHIVEKDIGVVSSRCVVGEE